MNLKIIGLTSSGKSTLGDKITKLTGYKVFDLDREIEKDKGMRIHEMFDVFQDQVLIDSFFIDKLDELSKKENAVVVIGGYTGMSEDVKQLDDVFCLDISYDLFYERIIEAKRNNHLDENKNKRIINQPDEEILKYYNERRPRYLKNANTVFRIKNNNDYLKVEKKLVEMIVNVQNLHLVDEINSKEFSNNIIDNKDNNKLKTIKTK